MQPFITWSSAPTQPLVPATSELHLWKIDLDSMPLEKSIKLLSSDEISRANQLNNMTSKQRFCAGRGGLRRILCNYLDCAPETIVFNYGEKGKPGIKTPIQPIQFNMSHAEDLAVVAISAAEPVGIDIELLKTRSGLLTIARRVFGKEISAKLETLDPQSRIQLFLEHWTELEAQIKAAGAGVFDRKLLTQHDIHSCHFHPQTGWIGNLALIGTKPKEKKWHAYNLT